MRWAVVQVADSTARYSSMKEVIGQPPLFQPTRLSLALVELMLVKSSCSLANWGSEETERVKGNDYRHDQQVTVQDHSLALTFKVDQHDNVYRGIKVKLL